MPSFFKKDDGSKEKVLEVLKITFLPRNLLKGGSLTVLAEGAWAAWEKRGGDTSPCFIKRRKRGARLARAL